MMIAAFIVFAVGLVSIVISAVLWIFLRRNIKDVRAKRRHQEKCLIGTIICWIIIFFFPTGSGPLGSADVFFKVLMTKTLLIIYTPPFFAFIISSNRKVDIVAHENKRPSHYYGSLEEAVRAQQSEAVPEGTEQGKREQGNPVASNPIPDKYSKYFLISLFVSPFLLMFADMAEQDILAGFFFIIFIFSCFGYLIWLLVRPSQ